jgi:RNA chaperone ProQ/FINO-like protein
MASLNILTLSLKNKMLVADRVALATASTVALTAEKKALAKRVAALRRKVALEYPAAFGGAVPVPLAVSIHAQIAEAYPDFTAGEIDRVLFLHTKQRAYVVSLRNGVNRMNLNGSDGGPVALAHRIRAGRMLVAMATES